MRLRSRGVAADARSLAEVDDIAVWTAVVIGSAVYFGTWRKEASEFVRAHKDVLATRPLWLFSSGPVGRKDLSAPKEIAEFETAPGFRGHEVFAGCLDRGALSIGERLVIKGVKAPYGDFRDWPAIDAWADRVGDELQGDRRDRGGDRRAVEPAPGEPVLAAV
ncbi:MAG: flavodoxin domain-containing protein [Actinomycetota bacterium]|nr:flavodoxin domain-containing protein [Actinomycetota bacterium]